MGLFDNDSNKNQQKFNDLLQYISLAQGRNSQQQIAQENKHKKRIN